MRIILMAVMSLFFSSAAYANQTDKKLCESMKQDDLMKCAMNEQSHQEKDLARLYENIREEMRVKEIHEIKNLELAQKFWTKARDKHCSLVTRLFEGGREAPLYQASCLVELTSHRVQELKILLEDMTQ
jgi:uncharacterized protein YecT (DUF1311 family)